MGTQDTGTRPQSVSQSDLDGSPAIARGWGGVSGKGGHGIARKTQRCVQCQPGRTPPLRPQREVREGNRKVGWGCRGAKGTREGTSGNSQVLIFQGRWQRMASREGAWLGRGVSGAEGGARSRLWGRQHARCVRAVPRLGPPDCCALHASLPLLTALNPESWTWQRAAQGTLRSADFMTSHWAGAGDPLLPRPMRQDAGALGFLWRLWPWRAGE